MFARRAFLIGLLVVGGAACPVHAFAAQLTLTWTDASDNEIGFKIERRPGLTETYTEIARPGADTTAYVDSNLPAGTTYCYRLRAFNGAGDSDYSNEACGVTPAAFALTVIRSGTGSGSVGSTPSGISCGMDCSEPYPSGTTVALAATPDTGSTFAGWSGGCGGAAGCTVTLSSNTTVGAAFTAAVQSFTLSVTQAGKGSGSVSSTPSGIDCGTDCSEPYPSGTTLTLTAAPDTGSTFAGWSGACSGKGNCVVTLTADTMITASFRRQGNLRK